MVGKQVGFDAIDFSAFTVHRSTLGPDGRSDSLGEPVDVEKNKILFLVSSVRLCNEIGRAHV